MFRRPTSSQPNQPTLTADTKRVQDEESVVSQPQPSVRDGAGGEVDSEVGVADDFGDRPGYEHGAVDGGKGDGVGERGDDAPDQEDAGGDLHEGREEGGAYDA